MREHPIIGERILLPLPGLGNVAKSRAARARALGRERLSRRPRRRGDSARLAHRARLRRVQRARLRSPLPPGAPGRRGRRRARAMRRNPVRPGGRRSAARLPPRRRHRASRGAVEGDLAELLAPPESDGDARQARARAARADHDRLGRGGRRGPRRSRRARRRRGARRGRCRHALRSPAGRPTRACSGSSSTPAISPRGRSGARPTRPTRLERRRRPAAAARRGAARTRPRSTIRMRSPPRPSCCARSGSTPASAVPIMLGGSAWGELWAARAEGRLPGFGAARRPLPRDDRGADRGGGRPHRALRADGRPRIQGSAHRRRQPARARGAARALRPGGAGERGRRGRAPRRPRQPQGAQRRSRPCPWRPGARRGRRGAERPRRTGRQADRDGLPARRRRVLPRCSRGGSAEEAHAAGERAIARLAAAPAPVVSASFGVASIGLGAGRPADLLRAADHALYVAKRTRSKPGLRRGREPRRGVGRRDRPERQPAPAASGAPRRSSAAALLRRSLDDLDGELASRGAVPAPAGRRRAHLRCRRRRARLDLVRGDGKRVDLATFWTVNLRAGRTWSKGAGPGTDEYATSDYPETARILTAGGSFVVSADDPDGDPGEVELLRSVSGCRPSSRRRRRPREAAGSSRSTPTGRPAPLEQAEPDGAAPRRGGGAPPTGLARASAADRLSPQLSPDPGRRPADVVPIAAMEPNEALAELLEPLVPDRGRRDPGRVRASCSRAPAPRSAASSWPASPPSSSRRRPTSARPARSRASRSTRRGQRLRRLRRRPQRRRDDRSRSRPPASSSTTSGRRCTGSTRASPPKATAKKKDAADA